MNDDFFLEDDEFDDSGMIIGGEDDDEEDGGGGLDDDEEIAEDIKEEEAGKKKIEEIYGDSWTATEIWLSQAYDTIQKAAKKNVDKEGSVLDDVVTTLVMANPMHTSAQTRSLLVKEALHKQGHARIVNTLYTPDTVLTSGDIEEDILEDESSSFNAEYAREAKERINDFVGYLANRDLSQDSIISRRRKMRQLPAFIIYLFSIGEYDLLIGAENMPPEYAKQIQNALETIQKEKFSIVEELAKRYESEGRQKVADRVRERGLAWFEKEPNEIRQVALYRDLDLTPEDVQIYREYRSKFMNASKAITQELISDLIEVVVDPEAMIYEKLKDKTRADAISDVKDVFKKWNEEVAGPSQLAQQVIWGDFSDPTSGE